MITATAYDRLFSHSLAVVAVNRLHKALTARAVRNGASLQVRPRKS